MLTSIFLSKDFYLIKIEEREMYIYINHEILSNFSIFLKLNTFFKCESLLDIYCIDYTSRNKRFEITYVFLSYFFNFRLNVRTIIDKTTNLVSLSNIFKSANWLEREIWDLFCVFFTDHSDLRRILTDYGFDGFPMRKDFPLSGFIEIKYDDQKKKVIIESIKFMQDYRYFDFLNPWVIK
jgi:NADH:ubiquinone oxidoreductase subunit C